jgi:hypothetical protein
MHGESARRVQASPTYSGRSFAQKSAQDDRLYFISEELVYAKFNARLNDPRSFMIFSCSSVIA